MGDAGKRTFNLTAELARYIDQAVTAGTYASPSEVVRAGLRALQERDASAERWLRQEVAPVYDAMEADPSRGIPAREVVAAIRARHATRLKSIKRDP